MKRSEIRIGGACAGWGDGTLAVPQLVQSGGLDYLVFDFLSEFFLPVMGRMRAQNPKLGHALDFAGPYLATSYRDIARQGIKIIANAGGVNPKACADALCEMARNLGFSPKIAIITGDDLINRVDQLRQAGYRDMTTGASIPERPLTVMNAYLGAAPIAKALDLGADIVITGRIVDSALVLGPLMHEFGWQLDEYDKLAAGTVIGHLLECGAQVTGGIFTDWRDVPDWANIGYPIAECAADGSAIITKPKGTGGLVSIGTVAEQLLYEIGDPQSYFMPDVTADFTAIKLEAVGQDRVKVSGARGLAPTATYKVFGSYDDGLRLVLGFPIRGPEAAAKAERVASEVLIRVRKMLREANMADFTRTHVEIMGAEASYGARARHRDSREVICRIAAEHEDRRALDLLVREQGTGSISMAPGHVGMTMGPTISEVARNFSFLLPKSALMATVTIGEHSEPVPLPTQGGYSKTDALMLPSPPPVDQTNLTAQVPLLRLAWVRNGDKGDISNVAVIARHPDYLPYIAAALSEDALAQWYAHVFKEGRAGRVERFYLPGISAFNFLLHDALDGGCTGSMRFDPLGKSMAQDILDLPIPVPPALAQAVQATA